MAKASPRFLSQMLLLSIALNVSLLITFFLIATKEREIPLVESAAAVPQASQQPLTNSRLLSEYVESSYHQLLTILTDSELVEEGYAKRDLALGCLVSFYHFHIERALGTEALEKRSMLLTHPQKGKSVSLTLFPGLTDAHYQAILHYLQTEKWPFTPLGLYQLIQRSLPFPDPTLIEAFAHTSEYRTVQALFSKSGQRIENGPLIQMLAEAKWRLVTDLGSQQRLLPDLTPNRRRTLLLDCLQEGSFLAARLLIEADAEFAAARLSDDQILRLFELYPAQSKHLERFSRQLLKSPRSDRVRQMASTKLHLSFEDRRDSTPAAPAQKAQKGTTHTVQEGESLWMIARKYNTSVDALIERNALTSDVLHPNQTLVISVSN